MRVQLSKDDRVIIRYLTPPSEGAIGMEFLIAEEETREAYEEETREAYVLVTRTEKQPEGQYEMYWRGNVETCLKHLVDEISTFEQDWHTEQNRGSIEFAPES